MDSISPRSMLADNTGPADLTEPIRVILENQSRLVSMAAMPTYEELIAILTDVNLMRTYQRLRVQTYDQERERLEDSIDDRLRTIFNLNTKIPEPGAIVLQK